MNVRRLTPTVQTEAAKLAAAIAANLLARRSPQDVGGKELGYGQ